MKLVLVADQRGDNPDYIRAAGQAGWELAAELDYAAVEAALPGLVADAAVLVARQVNETVLRSIRTISRLAPMPVLLFTADPLQQSIREAVSAGVAAYVVNCTDINRLASLLEVAVVRFAETRRLQQELHKAKTSLSERKTVDRAKGIIMRQRNVSEDQAYQLLRRLAMQRNRRIGEVAAEVIAAAEVLI
jgi:response regulator NasT